MGGIFLTLFCAQAVFAFQVLAPATASVVSPLPYPLWNSAISSYTCNPGEQPHIVEAFYTDESVWKERSRTRTREENVAQCARAGPQRPCRERLDQRDLNALYRTCGITETNCTFSPDEENYPLSTRSQSVIEYICVPESATTDPCQNNVTTRTTQNLMLTMLHGTTLQSAEQCVSECVLTPLGYPGYLNSILFSYNILFENEDAGVGNSVEYTVTHQYLLPARRPEDRETLTRSRYEPGKLLSSVKEVRLRFNITDMQKMTRLWMSLNGVQFHVRCTTTSLRMTEKVDTETTPSSSERANREVDNGTLPSDHADVTEPSPEKVAIIITSVIAALLAVGAVVCLAVLICLQKQRQPQKSHLTEVWHEDVKNVYNTSLLLSDVGDYAECLPQNCVNDSARRETPQTGRDVVGGDYCRLQHEPRGVTIDSEESSNYDHMTLSKDVYSSLQREPKRREVVDNEYSSCTSK
ncbi:hypothetical protein BaRGS_00020970 [Batillaria attramentaria]|uniref:Uncharacterized protein n=1 Tax=Batillaria attramentaria TaxID=370345 RepID=A0ABD0KKG9_9CAEN